MMRPPEMVATFANAFVTLALRQRGVVHQGVNRGNPHFMRLLRETGGQRPMNGRRSPGWECVGTFAVLFCNSKAKPSGFLPVAVHREHTDCLALSR